LLQSPLPRKWERRFFLEHRSFIQHKESDEKAKIDLFGRSKEFFSGKGSKVAAFNRVDPVFNFSSPEFLDFGFRWAQTRQ